MKITQITYTGFGGLASVVFSLIGADKKKSHQWSIGFIGNLPLDDAYPVRCEQHGVQYATFRSVTGRPFRAWLALSRWLAVTKPDVVICHSINSILACSWYAWRHNALLIAVEHTPNQVKTRMEWVFSRLSMLLADRVVVLTEEYRDELGNAHGWLFRGAKVSVISNGIDTDVFYPDGAPTHTPVRSIRLGMAARFSFSKRQDLLVAVVERLATLRPTLAVEFAFAGDGDEFVRVMQLAACSSVAPRIRFDGLLPEDDVAPWLRRLNVYVHATDGETLSTSLLQAMATGLPIIASDVPGVSNLLGKDGEYGVCVDNDVDTFTHAILALIDDPDRYIALGLRSRQRILDNYSNQMMLNRYLEVIESCH